MAASRSTRVAGKGKPSFKPQQDFPTTPRHDPSFNPRSPNPRPPPDGDVNCQRPCVSRRIGRHRGTLRSAIQLPDCPGQEWPPRLLASARAPASDADAVRAAAIESRSKRVHWTARPEAMGRGSWSTSRETSFDLVCTGKTTRRLVPTPGRFSEPSPVPLFLPAPLARFR